MERAIQLSLSAAALLTLFRALAGEPAGGASAAVTYSLDPARVAHAVEPGIYSQYLEHVYSFNSVHGGLWGDLVLNGCLQPNPASVELWSIREGELVMARQATTQPLWFGQEDWTDYEFSAEALKEAGPGGFGLVLRATDHGSYQLRCGGWGNTGFGFERNGGVSLLPRAPGAVEPNRWQHVRVRCTGPRLEAWLDDQPILDLTEADRPLLTGRAGVTAEQAQMRFRNLKVTALTGQALFSGPPTKRELTVHPPDWEVFGAGDFGWESSTNLGRRPLLKLTGVAPEGETGVAQKPIYLRAGEHYQGRVVVGGEAPKGVVVRLTDEAGKTQFEEVISAPGKTPSEHKFEFSAARTVEAATLRIALLGRGEVQLAEVSLFPQAALDTGGFRPDLLEAMKALKPAFIRYPGGSFESIYRWKDGIGPRATRQPRPHVAWEDSDPNQFGTDEFLRLCELVGATPILVVNRAAGLKDAVDWWDYCNGGTDPKRNPWGALRKEYGHPKPYNVEYWEFGNEVWELEPDDYAREVRLYSEAVRALAKAVNKPVKIIACGSYGYDQGPGQADKTLWNSRLLARAGRYIDLLSLHYFNGLGWPEDHLEDPRKFEAFIRTDLGALIRKSSNPKLQVYCSEWGMMNSEWRSGLYAAGLLNGFERAGQLVTMSSPTVWLQAVRERDNYAPRWASSVILFDHRRWCPAPTYLVAKLWRDHFAPSLLKVEGPDGPLNVTATKSADGQTLYFKAVNPGPQPIEVLVTLAAGFTARAPSLELIGPGDLHARNTPAEPARIQVVAGEVRAQGQSVRFTMPRESAGVLTLR